MQKPGQIRRVLAGVAALGLVAALAGCGGGSGDGGTAAKGAKAVVVNMENTTFNPKTLQVAKGTTVKWVNKDQVDHSVWEGDPGASKQLFKTEDLSSGKEFTYTFDQPGTYKIHCNTASHHLLGMTMQVVVK